MSYIKNASLVGLVAYVVLVIVLIIFWPFAVIAALNTLFPLLSIPYSFLSWLSIVVINITYFIPKHVK